MLAATKRCNVLYIATRNIISNECIYNYNYAITILRDNGSNIMKIVSSLTRPINSVSGKK